MTAGDLHVEVITTENLGDRSYVVHADGAAVVVDPQRDIDRVLDIVERRDLRVMHVLETHLHNDYITGGLELADRTGAAYVVPGDAVVAYGRTPAFDGDEISAGDLTFQALATPGHTPHHLSYVVSLDGRDRAVFTGGSLLFRSVGRTDLVAPSLTERLAHDQWRSARRIAELLPGEAQVYPTHGFGSFCSATPITEQSSSTVADEQQANPALQQDEDDFVREMLVGLDAYPAYYAHMAVANAAGPPPVDLSPAPVVDAREIRRRLDAGEWVVDLRTRAAFARGHLPRTLSFEAEGNVPTYLGWTIPWGTPVTLLGSSAEQVAHVQRELVRIGIDRPAGQAVGEPKDWLDGGEIASYDRVGFRELAAAAEAGRELIVLDVRRKSEWREGHLDGALNVPLHELLDRIGELPAAPLWVHCSSGYRASVAASMLDRAGREVVLIDDEWDHARDAGLPIRSA